MTKSLMAHVLHVVIVLLLVVAPASAQTPPDTQAILQAALIEAIAQTPQGGLGTEGAAIDPRVLSTSPRSIEEPSVRERSGREMRSLARALNAEVAYWDDVRLCEGRGPTRCRLEGASILLRASDPVVSGETAVVEVQSYFSSGSDRQPVAIRQFVITVVRGEDGWEVVEAITVRAS